MKDMKTVLCMALVLIPFTCFGMVSPSQDIALLQTKTDAESGNLMVCYYLQTSYFPVSKVPANLCTHIIYSSATVSTQGIKPKSSKDLQVYKALTSLKQKNPGLKVLLSLMTGFDGVIAGGTTVIENFSQAAIKFLQSYGFDGVDLDWEFPSVSQKDNFTQFIQILQSKLKGANLLLSAAIPNNPYRFKGFDAKTLSRAVDFMTVMAYDFHLYIKNVDNTTGYNSPLFTPKGENKYLSSSAMINYYLGLGMPAEKLLLGLPLYGRSWTLASASKHDLHSPAVGKGAPGPYRGFTGVYLYPDVCVAETQGATSVNDEQNVASYLYANTTWVAFDGRYTVETKIKWMKSQGLGGVGVWAVHLDDIDGVCKLGTLPLLNTIKSNL